MPKRFGATDAFERKEVCFRLAFQFLNWPVLEFYFQITGLARGFSQVRDASLIKGRLPTIAGCRAAEGSAGAGAAWPSKIIKYFINTN